MIHQAGTYFVTSAKRPMDVRRVHSSPSDRSTGAVCDQSIAMNGLDVSKHYPEHLCRIRLEDVGTGNTRVFLTNNTALLALTIATQHKPRWQVELLFKWIGQHLRIKKFLGTSKNPAKCQVYCAEYTYGPVTLVKKKLQLDSSLHTLLLIRSVPVFEKTQLSCDLPPDLGIQKVPLDANRLNLFNI